MENKEASLEAVTEPKQKEKQQNANLEKQNNLRHMLYFPSPYELAVLSEHVYKDSKKGDPATSEEKENPYYNLTDWMVTKVLEDSKSGYSGRIYCNRKKRQIVLAHRGTDPKNLKALATDFNSIY